MANTMCIIPVILWLQDAPHWQTSGCAVTRGMHYTYDVERSSTADNQVTTAGTAGVEKCS